LPYTPKTVTVTSLPIITVSPTRLVNISIFGAPEGFLGAERRYRNYAAKHSSGLVASAPNAGRNAYADLEGYKNHRDNGDNLSFSNK
jgi:hypothetical protein